MLVVMVLGTVKQGLDSRLGETPCTSIEGFFLTPNDSLGVGVSVKIFLQLLPREGVQLLYTSDGGVL